MRNEDQALAVGTIVHVTEYGGKVLERLVLSDKGQRIVICPEDEYFAASKEGRKPVGISFPKSAVVSADWAGGKDNG